MRLPADEELIAYLDGELPPEKQEEIRRLLAASWEARNRLAAIERDIQLYIDVGTHHSEPHLPPADLVWERIAPRLAERPQPHPWRRYTIAAVILVAALALNSLRPKTPHTVSAAEVLGRAETAEAAAPSGVMHRTLRVSRMRSGEAKVQSTVWEVWRTPGSTRVRHQPHTPLIEEVRRALSRSGFDADRPLSAVAYASWRRGIQPFRESVERRDAGFEVRTVRDAERGLIEASLTLRSGDFHPIAQQLTIRTDSGPELYELREMDLRIVAFDSLPRNFFEPDVTVPPPPPPLPGEPQIAAPEPVLLPDPADLLASTLSAHAALHRTGECATANLAVLRQAPDRVDIRGTVPTSERKARLLDSLAHLPLLRLDIQIAEPAAAPVPDLQQIASRLRLPEPEAISLLAYLEAITADAEALRNHTAGLDPLDAASSEVFGKAVQEHLAALQINLANAARILDPNIQPSPGARSSVADFASHVLRSCSLSAAGQTSRHALAAACASLSRHAR